MYDDWLEGCPILIGKYGFKEHNIKELMKARDYHIREGNKELAEHYQKLLEKY